MCIAASVLSIPARIFPIYFPVGNMATGFFVILALLAGVVGMGTSLTGLNNVSQWNEPNLFAAADSSLVTLALTIFAMGYKLFCSFLFLLHNMTQNMTILEKLGHDMVGYDN